MHFAKSGASSRPWRLPGRSKRSAPSRASPAALPRAWRSRPALAEWIAAAETLRDFVQETEKDDTGRTRDLIKEVLRAENRIRAINVFPPRMFNGGSSSDG